jgi:hypothetical protein
MIEAEADPKSVQGHMRHSRIATAMDIYPQHGPESQQLAMVKMMHIVESGAQINRVCPAHIQLHASFSKAERPEYSRNNKGGILINKGGILINKGGILILVRRSRTYPQLLRRSLHLFRLILISDDF